MTLKLRLNLIVTGLLALIILAGAYLTLINARQNTRAEIISAENLVVYLFDTAILNNPDMNQENFAGHEFNLQRLNHMRHLKIELSNKSGKVVDSNQAGKEKITASEAPAWFQNILNKISPQWEPITRRIEYHGQLLGTLIITPEPGYEYAEIWKQIKDLMILAAIFFISVNLMIVWAVAEALEPTEKILIALNWLEQGDLGARLPAFDLPELARIGQKFNRMVETLEQSVSRNHKLTQQLITLQEEERKSLARDLHDEFGQCLTAIHTDATVVLKISEKKYPELLDSAMAISKLSRHLMDLVSGLLQRLRPGILHELGLVSALHELSETWQSRHKAISYSLNINAIDDKLEEATGVTIYRLVQECLTNISKHANASTVTINLSKESRMFTTGIQIKVQDNGKGFDDNPMDGLGLPGMRERVEGLGGELVIVSSLGNGTEITAWIPENPSS